jgi:hypothetical protein
VAHSGLVLACVGKFSERGVAFAPWAINARVPLGRGRIRYEPRRSGVRISQGAPLLSSLSFLPPFAKTRKMGHPARGALLPLWHVQFWEAENSWRLGRSHRGGHRRDIPCLVDASGVRTVNSLKTRATWSMRVIAIPRQLAAWRHAYGFLATSRKTSISLRSPQSALVLTIS